MSKEGAKPRIDELFSRMVGLKASDLHLKSGNPPIFRVDGQLRRTKSGALSSSQIEALVTDWLGVDRVKDLRRIGNLDLGHDFEGGRARVALFVQRGQMSLAARLVKTSIPSIEELNLPPALARITEFNVGLVLICGITGAGKSTTLACLLEMIGSRQARHILTFEDPIEYLHHDKLGIINQREYGLDFKQWGDAISAGVRADPDIMLIGEMRDLETFQLCLSAAETGHLVLSTLHTSSAPSTIGRILEFYPAGEHKLVREALAFNLKAVACQMLVPSFREDIGRVPAMEIMYVNAPIRKAIAEGKDAKVGDLILDGEKEGMQSWTTAFANLIKADLVEKKTARQYVPNKDALDLALKGIRLSTSTLD
jgi:twitching motility protein PilT